MLNVTVNYLNLQFFSSIFLLKKIQLMIEKYFIIFFIYKILMKVNGEALIE